MSLWDYIVWPFARLMEFLYNWTQNYGVSVILFALVVNLILLPFMAKSKKSMMRTTRFQPKMKALEKKYADNKEKYQQEVAKLYREEGINPMSGCLWSLLPLGVGTMTAMLPTMKVTSPHIRLRCDVASKHWNVR